MLKEEIKNYKKFPKKIKNFQKCFLNSYTITFFKAFSEGKRKKVGGVFLEKFKKKKSNKNDNNKCILLYNIIRLINLIIVLINIYIINFDNG